MNKLVDEAPYHPGYEDAVVPPKQRYTGVNVAKMVWKQKPLSDEELDQFVKEYFLTKPDESMYEHIRLKLLDIADFARAIEERLGIK